MKSVAERRVKKGKIGSICLSVFPFFTLQDLHHKKLKKELNILKN